MTKKIFLLFVLLLIVCGEQTIVFSQTKLGYTTKAARIELKNKLINESIKANLNYSLTDSTEKNYLTAFWAAELILYTDAGLFAALKKCFIDFTIRSLHFQRGVLECVYTLFPDSFVVEAKQVLQKTSDPKIFAMCAVIAARTKDNKALASTYLKSKFNNYHQDPILYSLEQYLIEGKRSLSEKEISSLVSKGFLAGNIIIYSFQKSNRDNVGMLIIRDANGSFIKDSSGKLFSVPQLARSISNMPSFLTNGNTPCGVYSVQGFGNSNNVFIGPTTNLQMIMPFEGTAKDYFHSKVLAYTNWTAELYQSLLPNLLKNNPIMNEVFYAGLAGRSEIIAHGTTIDPEFYSHQKYYPNTPSLGCLCAFEKWSSVDGSCQLSYQQMLIDKLNSIGFKKGFLVLLEIDGEDSSITQNELEILLGSALKN